MAVYQGHICVASLPINTADHLATVAADATRLGFDVCWLSFGSVDTASVLSGFRPGTTGINDVSEFVAHLELHQPVAVFLQSPYPEHYPDWFWEMSSTHPYCYAGYGASLDTWDWGHYELPSLKSCRWLMAESDFVKDKFIEYGNDASLVVVTGNPLMFELRRRLASLSHAPKRPRTILWAPHWSTSWFEYRRGYSRWEEAVHALLRVAKDAVATHFIVRPHPLLQSELVGRRDNVSVADQDTYTQAFFELLELHNVSLSTASFLDDVLRSDALLTDGLSIIAYFAATGRPMAIIRDADSPPFNAVGDQLCRASDVVADGGEIEAWLLESALGEPHPLSDERVALSRELHPTWTVSPLGILADRLSR